MDGLSFLSFSCPPLPYYSFCRKNKKSLVKLCLWTEADNKLIKLKAGSLEHLSFSLSEFRKKGNLLLIKADGKSAFTMLVSKTTNVFSARCGADKLCLILFLAANQATKHKNPSEYLGLLKTLIERKLLWASRLTILSRFLYHSWGAALLRSLNQSKKWDLHTLTFSFFCLLFLSKDFSPKNFFISVFVLMNWGG